jgi:hypothetical protein
MTPAQAAAFAGRTEQAVEPSDSELESIELEGMDDLDSELAKVLDAKRLAIPSKAKRRDRPTFGIQKLDSLYKNPENWEPWANVTLVYKPNRTPKEELIDWATERMPPEPTILGFFICYKHKTVIGASKLVRSPADPLLGHETRYVSDPWYVEEARRHRAAPSLELHFPVSLVIILDDGLRSEGEHVVHVGATRGVGIRRAVLDSAVRLHFKDVILYLPAGLDILDGLALECKMKLKEAFDAQG